MRSLLGKGVLLTALSGLLGGAMAFELDGGRWDDATTTFYVDFPDPETSLTGQTWSQAFISAMDTWSQATDFTFKVQPSYLDPCQGYSRNEQASTGFPAGDGDRRNGTDFRADVCGNDFGDGVLAITLSYSEGGTLGFPNFVESDIIFNSNYDWMIYEGTPQTRIDFNRVALHELGHALGLNHELVNASIMAPRITSLDQLTVDDIAGVNTLYSQTTTCLIENLGLHAVVNGTLETGDCQVRELYNTGSDTSFVDAYRLTISKETQLHLAVRSAVFDTVFLITTPTLGLVEVVDDTEAGCDAVGSPVLAPGEYLLLVNTYVEPEKCGTNTGPYTLTISDSAQPLMGGAANTNTSIATAAALFAGGATADGGQSYANRFTASQAIDVSARIGVDPVHQGQPGKIYVIVSLSNGQHYMQLSNRKFVRFDGKRASLEPLRADLLDPIETIDVVQGLRGDFTGLRGLEFTLRVGYAVDSHPADIYYGSKALRFSIDP